MSDAIHMQHALRLALHGHGAVEPNPMVGCVIIAGDNFIGEGWHKKFGDAHAEVNALADAGERARGATVYVTLEPCSHHGKTPPCAEALIAAGVARVVVAMRDPYSKVAGQGIAALEKAGIAVEVGLLEAEAKSLNAPYLKLLATGRPWVVAKWAMSIDGKTSTLPGESHWISGAASQVIVHELRGRMDAIIVGRNTAAVDDPLLTVRPPGPRTPTRVVIDSLASLSLESKLVQTARETPTLVAVSEEAPAENRDRLIAAGCEVFVGSGATRPERLGSLLDEFGRRRWTNVLLEGGAELLCGFFSAGMVDEVHAFIAPKRMDKVPDIDARGATLIRQIGQLVEVSRFEVGPDVYIQGKTRSGGLL